jgi:hypothetical protein
VKGFTLFVLLSSLVISAPQAAPTLLVLCVLKTRSGRSGDEVGRGSGVISSYRQAEPGDVQARLCQGTDEFGLRYSSSRRRVADGIDALSDKFENMGAHNMGTW